MEYAQLTSNGKVRAMIRVERRRLVQTGLCTPKAARSSAARKARMMRDSARRERARMAVAR